jgi:TetR/AcrR family transcriptional regulator, repressor for neighboring sulfatase
VRDVSARARVNHGLIHRHFASKRELVRAVMADLTGKHAAEVAALPPSAMPATLATTAEASAHWRVLARALFDGIDPRELQGGFPVVKLLLERAAAAQQSGLLRRDVDVRLFTATSLALGLGWLLFEPFVLAATV